MRDTIVAIASAPGGARRGVLRLSGDRARALVEPRLLDLHRADEARGSVTGLGERGAYAGSFDDGRGRVPALVLWMPGPRSFTREDVVELHLPGNPWLMARALESLLADGARRAEPGEFTRRAFEHGRIDLTRAEGVLELVSARTEGERRAAVALLEGGLARRVEGLRARLDDLRALCEASLDFDEDDTGAVALDVLARELADAASALDEATDWERARPPRAGLPRVALVGAPNAGKSTLFNALAGPDAVPALVGELAGTTRDPLRVEVVAGEDLRVELFDLAGLATAARDELDAAGQLRARELLDSADLVLPVMRADLPDPDAAAELAARLPADAPRLLLWTQVDRAEAVPLPPATVLEALGRPAWLACGQPLEAVVDRIRAGLAQSLGDSTSAGALSRELAEVHARALAAAGAELERAREALAGGEPLDLVASVLRGAVDALDAVVGHTSPEDLLDRIFSRFCIGK